MGKKKGKKGRVDRKYEQTAYESHYATWGPDNDDILDSFCTNVRCRLYGQRLSASQEVAKARQRVDQEGGQQRLEKAIESYELKKSICADSCRQPAKRYDDWVLSNSSVMNALQLREDLKAKQKPQLDYHTRR